MTFKGPGLPNKLLLFELCLIIRFTVVWDFCTNHVPSLTEEDTELIVHCRSDFGKYPSCLFKTKKEVIHKLVQLVLKHDQE